MLTLKMSLPKPFESLGGEILLFRGLLSDSGIELAEKEFASREFNDRELAANIHYGTDPSHRPEIAYVPETNSLLTVELTKCANDLLAHLQDEYGFLGIRGCTQFRLNQYQDGRGYRTHVDRSNNSAEKTQRAVSIVVGVGSSEDYEGGLLSFKRQGIDVKLGRGDVVVFPSGYTHPHSVTPVTRGLRKTIVSWMV